MAYGPEIKKILINYKTLQNSTLFIHLFIIAYEYLKRFVQPDIQPFVQRVVQRVVKCVRTLTRQAINVWTAAVPNDILVRMTPPTE